MNTLDYAIKMEQDGESFYREQAQLNKGNELYTVCNLLAEDEKVHARILENKKNNTQYQLVDSEFLTNAKNVFTGMKKIEAEGKQMPSQLDFYRVASEMEKQSIDLYTEFLEKASEESEKKLFEFLVLQEKQHYEALEEMSRLLHNAEWWIESPEFGRRREEY